MTLALTPAAVCQCFTLVSLCTSIADPNWIQVQNCSDSSSKLIYGVAFTLHAYQNLTDTGPLGGLHGWGMWLLYSLAVLCYIAVILSSSSFLLDFLGAAVTHSKLVTSLHVLTADQTPVGPSVFNKLSGALLKKILLEVVLEEGDAACHWFAPGSGIQLEKSSGLRHTSCGWKIDGCWCGPHWPSLASSDLCCQVQGC